MKEDEVEIIEEKAEEKIDDKENMQWEDARGKTNLIIGMDERVVIKIYRFCKNHREFFLGIAVTIIFTVLVLK